MKSDADQGSWGLCSCVGTDRDDQGKTTPAHITDAGQGDDLLSGSRADNHSTNSLLSNERYRGDHQRRWRLLAITFTVIIRQTGNTPGANNPSSKNRETIGTLVSINGSHSRRGKGVGWVAFPPPHITVCSLYIVAVGRLICGSLLLTAGRGLRGWIERKTA